MSDAAEKTPLEALSDMAEAAHARMQDLHPDYEPLITVRRGMREQGIPADAMTVDCQASGKRILLILHDDYPDTLLYQMADLDTDAGNDFHQLAFEEVSAELLFAWMEAGFVGTN
jgi:hypothetical protein